MRTYSRIVPILPLLLSLGCAGALWSDKEHGLLVLSFGNSEFVNSTTCISGGPVSEGLVGMVGDLVQGALGIFTGRAPGEDEPSQDTLRQAGCLETQPDPGATSPEVPAETQ